MLAMRQDAGLRHRPAARRRRRQRVSDVLLQMQADLLRIPVDRPEMVETTAFGAAALAGLSCGFWQSMEELSSLRRSQRVFLPERPQADCDAVLPPVEAGGIPGGGLDRALNEQCVNFVT